MSLYEMPILDDTFDAAAADVCREFMMLYDQAPPEVKSMLENIAIKQRLGSFTRPEVEAIERLRSLVACVKRDATGEGILLPTPVALSNAEEFLRSLPQSSEDSHG